MENMTQSFTLNREENRRIMDWVAALPEGKYGSIGGRITYSFTPTSLGLITVVTDGLSGAELNLTNFEEW